MNRAIVTFSELGVPMRDFDIREHLERPGMLWGRIAGLKVQHPGRYKLLHSEVTRRPTVPAIATLLPVLSIPLRKSSRTDAAMWLC